MASQQSRGARHSYVSPRKAIYNLLHGHEVAGHRFGSTRALNLPGLSITVGDMVAALASVAGRKPVDLIHWQENEAIKRIVDSWPGDFDTKGAAELGFSADLDFTRVVRAYIEDASQSS